MGLIGVVEALIKMEGPHHCTLGDPNRCSIDGVTERLRWRPAKALGFGPPRFESSRRRIFFVALCLSLFLRLYRGNASSIFQAYHFFLGWNLRPKLANWVAQRWPSTRTVCRFG